MTTTYKGSHIAQVSDGFNQLLNEAVDHFSDNDISIFGNGISDIMSNNTLFESYKEKLLGSAGADDAAMLDILFENTRMATLNESSLSGIQPVASLTLPMLRKFWPRVAAIHVIPTEPVVKPRFDISYYSAYIEDSTTGEKQYLPAALTKTRAADMNNRKELSSAPIVLPVSGADLFSGVGASVLAGDGIDIDFYVTSVEMTVLDAVGLNPEVITVELGTRVDSSTASLSVEVKGTHSDTTDTSDNVFISIDRRNGTLTGTSVLGSVASIIIKGYLSSENNTRMEQVGFDINHREINIGTGAKIAAPLNGEWLQDTMAMYNVDGASRVIEIMSDILAQKLDFQADDYIVDVHNKNGTDADAVQYIGNFNVRPSAAYTGSPKEWRDELRTVIDHVAISMRNDSNFTNGSLNIVGNELDTQLIPNVDWSFSSGEDERSAVAVNYSLGATSGNNRYAVTSSPNCQQGALKMVYIPNNAEQLTLKYYPYSFTINNSGEGNINPGRPNVPSVMVSRRHTFEKFTPLVAMVNVANNDGTLPA